MRQIVTLAALVTCGAALVVTADRLATRPVDENLAIPDGPPISPPINPPIGVRLFNLHDPGLVRTWPGFLETTPMLNDELLPPSLQHRLKNVVATYRTLTPIDQPAFFVATYFDLLSERLLAAASGTVKEISPLRVCPVFASGHDAPVSRLLAVASGLPAELFAAAPGQAERYRYLFLQTEFSHCRFLATIRAAEPGVPLRANQPTDVAGASVTFDVGDRSYTAILGTRDELRALLETVGEVDATAQFRQQMPDRDGLDEADVLSFVRLLSLLATDGKNGYAGIPVLFPLLNEQADGMRDADRATLRIADALDLAYRVRAAFREIVPFPIRDTNDLLDAKLAIMETLAYGGHHRSTDERVLLERFVSESDLLLTTTVARQKMPLTSD